MFTLDELTFHGLQFAVSLSNDLLNYPVLHLNMVKLVLVSLSSFPIMILY